ncbi:hypothetical protein SAMN05414137_107264 [Streptacidiphilus jiangxiensis]|uniref:Uncharacterized protein n=1 Tax=Streptacidiphilus jiangxiensis TaxID=235985 RepID=A0A1H7P960_STRJI|nr:hypothetical protein [Streptacidiphilus jiangxiensis]SEL31948.1 hypothetical protein SAMN05414137_107264 [Streptacidiphilus jiangxiensis]
MPAEEYCESPASESARRGKWIATGDQSVADCTRCGEPTEYRSDSPGAVLCPRCEWQQAQRGACSG